MFQPVSAYHIDGVNHLREQEFGQTASFPHKEVSNNNFQIKKAVEEKKYLLFSGNEVHIYKLIVDAFLCQDEQNASGT